jgi:hypothetical protein
MDGGSEQFEQPARVDQQPEKRGESRLGERLVEPSAREALAISSYGYKYIVMCTGNAINTSHMWRESIPH